MKTYITIKVLLDRDKNEISRFQLNETTADSGGKILDETEYNEDGSIFCKRIYRYFEDGSVKEYVETNPLNKLIERHVYQENDDGEIETVIYEYGDIHKVIKQFRFSDLGLADKATLFDENDQILGYETYIFNEEGKVIERIDSDEHNIEFIRHLNSYDDNGYLLKENKINDGILGESISYFYDSTGKIARKETNNISNDVQIVDEYHYDDHGNQIYNASFQNGILIFENKCTYDENNQLETEEFFEIDFWEKKITRHEKLLHLLKD